MAGVEWNNAWRYLIFVKEECIRIVEQRTTGSATVNNLGAVLNDRAGNVFRYLKTTSELSPRLYPR